MVQRNAAFETLVMQFTPCFFYEPEELDGLFVQMVLGLTRAERRPALEFIEFVLAGDAPGPRAMEAWNTSPGGYVLLKDETGAFNLFTELAKKLREYADV